jgi:hypothetical protein
VAPVETCGQVAPVETCGQVAPVETCGQVARIRWRRNAQVCCARKLETQAVW